MNDLHRKIAEEVMGWKLGSLGGISVWLDADGEYIMNVSHWKPTEDANDVFMVLHRMETLGYYWNVGSHDYGASFFKFASMETFTVEDDDELVAICQAAEKAISNE